MTAQLERRLAALQRARKPIYSIKGEPFILVKPLDARNVLLRHVVDEERNEVLAVSDLVVFELSASDSQNEDSQPRGTLTAALADNVTFSEAEWAEAERRYAAIKPVIDREPGVRVDAIAKQMNVSRAAVFNWARTFRETGSKLHLLPRKRGRKPGAVRLEQTVEELVAEVVEQQYGKRRLSMTRAYRVLQQRCEANGYTPPSYRTFVGRCHGMTPGQLALLRNLRKEYEGRHRPKVGSFPMPSSPYEGVMIDHTVSDVISVAEGTRLPVRRAYITLVIDIKTRLVIGWHVSYDPPSYIAAMMALTVAMLPKKELLAKYGLPDLLPCHGLIGTVYSDNAKEFRGEMMRKAVETRGTVLTLRPAKKPYYGGHIESLMKLRSTFEATEPGATFSNPQQRDGYASEDEATLTLREYEQNLLDFLLGEYNYRRHTSLGMSPMETWRRCIMQTGLPPPVVDPKRLIIDFLPFVERTVQQHGIEWDIIYYSEVLRPLINLPDPKNRKLKLKHLVKRDPRAPHTIYLFDPRSNRYLEIPSRDPIPNGVSLSELLASKRELRKTGAVPLSDQAIIDDAERRRLERTQNSRALTKSARSHHQRALTREQKAADAALVLQDSKPPPDAAAGERPLPAAATRPVAPLQAHVDEPLTPFEDDY